MAAALCYGVRGGGAQLCFHLQPGNYNTDTLIQVLAELRRFLGREEATLLWDGLPAYAPELDPVEGLWSWLKGTQLANLICPILQVVAEQAELGIERSSSPESPVRQERPRSRPSRRGSRDGRGP